ncbi:hypothetical protein DEW08_05020 [Azospirillum thermophilum]|uniref:Methyltransferase type 11 domain-containing protein n=2 Tax=Azospirillum thermophilum TaxID=2202148 RepID=A0A2S2CNC0_9PROT|nr:hypothetical protein DEW08_05020 [Azospirillum thermophilum]
MADMADKLNRPLLDAGGVAEGDRVLDLASGAGEPALSAARRVGSRGLVVGSDLVPGMMAGAVRRAAALEGEAPVFTAADMTALPFADGSFDRVTCRFGVMFVPDIAGALAELRRVLRPGGTAALMVWGRRDGNALFEVVGGAVEALLGDDGSMAPLFRFAEPGSLTGLMREGGWSAVAESDLTPVRKVPAGQPFWQATLDMVCGHRLHGLPEDRRAGIEAEITRRFAGRAGDGMIPLPAHVRIVVGTR